MRTFTPFAFLALLHIACGTELEKGASERVHATRAKRQFIDGLKRELDGRGNFEFDNSTQPLSQYTGFSEDNVLANSFDNYDKDKDGLLTYDELIEGLMVSWGEKTKMDLGFKALGLPNIQSFLDNHDLDGDGYLNKTEYFNVAESQDISPKGFDHCPSISPKVESCPSHQVLPCAHYFDTAESLCMLGHRNIIETCILSEPCSSICKCIQNVELAIEDKAVMVVENANGYSTTSLDLHQHEKRFIWLILLFLIGILALQVTAIAAVIAQLGSSKVGQVRWLDFQTWDGKGDPPACKIYLDYGGCGAILSGTARGCHEGGSRVYGNSCKDHFRYGSRGCGFLGLGCQSLCYTVNDAGCPCSTFEWTELDDINIVGSDIRSFHVLQPSECRNPCAQDTNCLAFVILPPDGTDNQINCFLKKAPLPTPFSTEKDVTSFIKVGQAPSAVCSKNTTVQGDWDYEFNGSTTTSKRSVLTPDSGNVTDSTLHTLSKRGIRDDLPFPYNPDTLRIAQFLVFLYFGANRYLTRELATSINPRLGFEIGTNTMQGTATGYPTLVNTAAPRWAGNEITYRLLQTFRTIMRSTAGNVDGYLNTVTDANSDVARALFPTTVQALLRANDQQIAQSTQTWTGRTQAYNPTAFAPTFPFVQVGYDTGNYHFQRGGVGPLSLEAAFLLAAQVAGVNWANVRTAAQNAHPEVIQTWFTGVLQPQLNSPGRGTCVNAPARILNGASSSRQVGYVQQVPRPRTDNDGRAGTYFALDLDPDLDPNDPNHNVFIFVVHTQDRASVLHVPNTNNLLNVQLTNYNPDRDASATGASYHLAGGRTTTDEPGEAGNPLPTGTLATRAFAHGHAALMNYQTFTNWVTQGAVNSPTELPGYMPFGFIHFYIIGEEFSAIFPRSNYLNRPQQ